MNGRPWTKKEVTKLLALAENVSQEEAAILLGRSRIAVASKVKALGIRWRQGTVSLNAIARAVGCSQSTVKRLANILLDPPNRYGTGNGSRFVLDYEDADRLLGVLKRCRVSRSQQIEAGKQRWQSN